MAKVSIIIPVYGVERYIEKCVRSLFEQTLTDIELVFVDDCSTDGSMDILRTLTGEYKDRLEAEQKTVHIERMPQNSGQADVRQYAITLCTGDYIIHCDSDDWVEPDMYRSMYEAAIRENADMVVCDAYEHEREKVIHSAGCRTTIINDFLSDCLTQRSLRTLWNKLIRREICQSVPTLPLANMGEDMVLISLYMLRMKKMTYVAEAYYHYIKTHPSITFTYTKEAVIVKYKQQYKNVKILAESMTKANQYFLYEKVLESLYFRTAERLVPCIKDKEVRTLWNRHFQNKRTSYFTNKLIPLKKKIQHGMILLRII